jgi:transposase
MPTQAPPAIKSLDFTSVRNHHEQAVFRSVVETANQFPGISHRPELLIDVACVALNRLPPRYIRHEADFAFFLSDRERADSELAVSEAVEYAFGFIQARTAMRARR